MKYFLPAKLNIDKLIIDQPPNEVKRFKKEYLLYIVDLISTIPARSKGLVLINDFVPINSIFLQKKIRNYRAYLDYLIKNKIIETDNRYLKGLKSKGYKFSSLYSGNIKTIQIRESNLLEREQVHSSFEKRKYGHLLKWYNTNLQIDRKLAQEYISADKERKLNNPTLLDQDQRNEFYKNPQRQYNCSLVAIEKISAAAFFPFIDTNVFRLHSCISNLRSELRNCLTYSGLQLVSIDIVNSQPYLSTLLLSSSFWNTQSTLSLKTRSLSSERELLSLDRALLCIDDINSNLITNIFYSYSSLSSFIMLCKSAETCIDSDLQRYKKLVQNGAFYEYMESALSNRVNIKGNRKKIKAAVFQVLFTDNRFLGQLDAEPKRIFKEMFPRVYGLLAQIKKKDKTNLPVLLQRIESYMILLVITKRIAKERPALPLFTIHDSIVTTVGNEEYVKMVITEEMEKAIGFAPMLSVDYWKAENLKFNNGELFLNSHSKVA